MRISLSGAIATVVEYSQPFTPAIGVISICCGWYARQVTYTYGPGLAAEWCIRNTIKSVGQETLGRMLGATVVAPVMVPSLVPWMATAATGAAMLLSIWICNIAYSCLFGAPGTVHVVPAPQPT